MAAYVNSVLSLAFLLSLWGCGEDQNFNQIFVDDGQKKAFDHLLATAQTKYDKGNYSEAADLAQQVVNKDGENEDAIVMLGYSKMAMAGADIINIAKNLVDQNAGTHICEGGEMKEVDSSTTSTATSDAENNPLEQLLCAFNVTDEQKALLILDNNESTDADGNVVVKGESDNTLFTDYPVDLPKLAGDARESGNAAITKINEVITLVCPFVKESAKVLVANGNDEDDARHLCTASTRPRHASAKVAFIWAVAHLVEAVWFNTIVVNDVDMLSQRVEALEGSLALNTTTNISQYLGGLAEMVDVLDVVMPSTSNASNPSMMNAMINNLYATVAAFTAVDGMPSSVTSSLDGFLTKIKASANKVKDSTSSASSNTGASTAGLKEQLNDGLAKELETQITNNKSDFSAEELSQACEAYDSFSSEEISACNGVAAPTTSIQDAY